MNAPDSRAFALFALNASLSFGEAIAHELGVSLAAHEERDFEDGEHKVRPLVNVRGKDVFVVQSLYSDDRYSVNDKLCRLLFFLGALRDASAARVHAVIPYLAYARKDRRTQPYDPVTTRYLAQIIEAMGVDRVISMEVHNIAAFHNAFRCLTEHLEPIPLFLEYLRTQVGSAESIVVVSPDAGGTKRAERFREALAEARDQDVPTAFVQKARARGQVSFGHLVGEVAGRVVVIIDDLIATGGTLVNAARTCKGRGAKKVYAAATHGVFTGEASAVLDVAELDQVVITDTIPPFRLEQRVIESKLAVLPAAALFAEAIRRIHTGGSLIELGAR